MHDAGSGTAVIIMNQLWHLLMHFIGTGQWA